MKKHSHAFRYAGSILALTSCIWSLNASAALQNLPMQLKVEVLENLDYSNLGTCPAGTLLVGRSAGSGNLFITTNNEKEPIKIPVQFAATDCADAAFNFSNGLFTVTALTRTADTFQASYYGSFVPANNPGALKINSGAFSILSGATGIFTGASGSGQLQGGGQLEFSPTYLPLPAPPSIPTSFKANLEGLGKISFAKSNFEEKYKIPPMNR